MRAQSKKPEISFRCFGGSGPLSIYWDSGPYGDAVEADTGNGVGWFSQEGKLLGIEFDDVDSLSDHQVLIFQNGVRVNLDMIRGRVTFKLVRPKKVKKARAKVA